MKGILMKPDMIQAIVEGRKTVTRRLDGLKEINQEPDRWGVHKGKNGFIFVDVQQPDDLLLRVFIKPRYHAGETVYIKEAYYIIGTFRTSGDDQVQIKYSPDGAITWVRKPRNKPIHLIGYHSPMMMPEWAARHFIKILAVRADRLQGMTEEDVRAEGITVMQGTWQSKKWNADTRRLELTGERHPYTGRYHFEVIWNTINPTYPFESNPWVFPYDFEFVKGEK